MRPSRGVSRNETNRSVDGGDRRGREPACSRRAAAARPARAATGRVGGASGTELADVQVLHLGNGAEIQTLDPHRNQEVPGVERSARPVRRVDQRGAERRPRSRAARNRGPSATTARPTCSRCAATRAGRTATRDREGLRLRPAAQRRPRDAVAVLRFILSPIVNADDDHGGQAGADRARRARDRRLHARDPAGEPDAVLSRPARAQLDLSRCTARASRSTAIEFTRPGNLVGNGAFQARRLGRAVAHQARPQPVLLGQREQRGSTRSGSIRPRISNAELQRYRAGELDQTYCDSDRADRLDPREPARRARHRAVPRQLLLRLQPHAPAVQGQPRICGAR